MSVSSRGARARETAGHAGLHRRQPLGVGVPPTCPPKPRGRPTRTNTEVPVYSYSVTDVGARGGMSFVVANRGVEKPYTRLLSWKGTVFSADTRT